MRSRSSLTCEMMPTSLPPSLRLMSEAIGEIERLVVQGAEALVDEHRLEADAAGVRLHDLGEAERQGQRRHERLAAGEGRDRPRDAGPGVVDLEVEAGGGLAAEATLGALQTVAALAS